MKLVSSLLITLLFVAFATCQSAPDEIRNEDTLEKDSTQAAPRFTWEIPSLHYVFASDRDIPYLTSPNPIDEESNVLKKEESEASKDINVNAIEQEDGLHEVKEINEDNMQNFGDASEGLQGHDLKLKLKLRLKDSHGASEAEEEEAEKEGKEAGSQIEVEEGLEKGKPSKMKSKKVKTIEERSLRDKPLKVNPFTEPIKEVGVTEGRSRISPRTLRYSRTRFSGYPLHRRYMSEASEKPFGDTGAPSLDVLYAKLTIAHKMLKALDDYMVSLENEKLVDTTRSSPQLAKRLELITELSRRLHNYMLAKIDKMNSKIESLKLESSGEHLGSLRSSPMGIRSGVQGIQSVRGVQGVQGVEGIQGEQNLYI